MPNGVDVDVWLRGNSHATTVALPRVPHDAAQWTDADVFQLLSEMLLAMEGEKNPGGQPPPVTLRGFSWIVNDDERGGGVLVHLEMQLGTASAGPFNIARERLTEMINRVMAKPASTAVH